MNYWFLIQILPVLTSP